MVGIVGDKMRCHHPLLKHVFAPKFPKNSEITPSGSPKNSEICPIFANFEVEIWDF